MSQDNTFNKILLYFIAKELEKKDLLTSFRENSLKTTEPQEDKEKLTTIAVLTKEETNTTIHPITKNLTYAVVELETSDKFLESVVTNKLKVFSEVEQIFINYGEGLINIKVFLNIDSYDYDLMSELFDKAQFPIKDQFKENLMHFDYLPVSSKNDLVYPNSDKEIYNRKNEVVTVAPLENYQNLWGSYNLL